MRAASTAGPSCLWRRRRWQCRLTRIPPLSADDVAEAVFWCATLPAHVNVNRLELMSVMQSFAGFSIKRS